MNAHGHAVEKPFPVLPESPQSLPELAEPSGACFEREFLGGLERRAFRQFEPDAEFALVFLRHPVAADVLVHDERGARGSGRTTAMTAHAVPQRPAENRHVHPLRPAVVW